MGKHTFYRIINLLILPIAAFIAIQVISLLLAAFANPAILFALFVIGCVPLYAFTANYFYNKSIRKGEPCKASLKDWIKVNAIVSILFSVITMFTCIGLMVALNDAQLSKKLWDQLPPNAGTDMTMEDFRSRTLIFCYVFLPYSILLLVHIIITFRLLGKYRHMFGSTNDPQ